MRYSRSRIGFHTRQIFFTLDRSSPKSFLASLMAASIFPPACFSRQRDSATCFSISAFDCLPAPRFSKTIRRGVSVSGSTRSARCTEDLGQAASLFAAPWPTPGARAFLLRCPSSGTVVATVRACSVRDARPAARQSARQSAFGFWSCCRLWSNCPPHRRHVGNRPDDALDQRGERFVSLLHFGLIVVLVVRAPDTADDMAQAALGNIGIDASA